MVFAAGVASSSSSNTIRSAGTDFMPTVDCMPRRYRWASPMRFSPAESVSVMSLRKNGLSSRSGPTRDLLKSITSVRVGKKYMTLRPMMQA